MPRSGGVYTLPAGNPVVTLTVISSAWANTTMADIATALTGSLPVDGTAPMVGPLRVVDGLVGFPGFAWGSEQTSGWYRIGAGNFGFSIGGTLFLALASPIVTIGGSVVTGALTLSISNTSTVGTDSSRLLLISGATNGQMLVRNAASAAGAAYTNSPAGVSVSLVTGTTSPLAFGTNATLAGFFDLNQFLNLSATGTAASTIFGPVYAGIPQNLQAGNYVLVLGDANKHLYRPSGALLTWTIPANASVAFPIGTAITFVNLSGSGMNLAITTDSLFWLPTASSGARVIAANGTCTILKVAATIWILTGVGIT